MLRVLSVCLSVVLVGVFLIYYGQVDAFLVGLLFRFVNEHLDEPVVLCTFFPTWCLCWDFKFNCIDFWSIYSYF